MSRVERKMNKKVAKLEKSMTISIILMYFSIILFFINSNFKFLLFLAIGYTLLSLLKDLKITDKSKRIFFN